MDTYNICLYKEADKEYTGCSLKTMELLDCALMGVCVVIRLNMVYLKVCYNEPCYKEVPVYAFKGTAYTKQICCNIYITFSDFLFAGLHTKPLLKIGLLQP